LDEIADALFAVAEIVIAGLEGRVLVLVEFELHLEAIGWRGRKKPLF
jgi:hypothetical protein